MPAIVIKINPNNLEEEKINSVATVLKNGGLAAFPTETVYGLAADFSNKEAVNKIYKIKNRPLNKPLTVAISSKEKIEELTKDITPAAYKLIDEFLPGPLTIILNAKGNGKIGIRIPKNNIALSILNKLNSPVVLTSANISGENSACSAEEVTKSLGEKIDVVVDAGTVELGKESTIVDATVTPVSIIREGVIAKEQIEKTAKTKLVLFVCTGNTCRSVMAKGLLEKFSANRDDVKVLSAGIMPAALSPTGETIQLLAKEGIDVSKYVPQRLNANMVKRADFILTMERYQEEIILKLNPEAKNRIYLLKEFVQAKPDSLEITDPIGKDLNGYRYCFADIKDAVKRLAQLL